MITINNVIDSLAAYIRAVLQDGTIQIVRGNANYVAQPQKGFIALTEIGSIDLETPDVSLDSDNQVSYYRYGKQARIQISFIGPNSGEWNAAVALMFRTEWACQQFTNGVTPLFLEESIQRPVVQGSAQNETQWIVIANLQYNPELSFGQQSATDLEINILQGVH